MRASQREPRIVTTAIGIPMSVMSSPRASDHPVTTHVNVMIPAGRPSMR
jgi:hypothetical protein